MTMVADKTLNLLETGNDPLFDSGASTRILRLRINIQFIPEVIQIEIRHNAPHP
jgi:hypothetical protein